MNYCFLDFINHLKQIDYENFDIVIFDNSKSKKFFRKIRMLSKIKVIYDDTDENKNILRLISSRNKILEYAIDKNYDYLLMMDSDVMVPSNIINVLMNHEKDVVSGLYFNIFKVDRKEKLLPVCYKSLNEKEFKKIKNKISLPKFVNFSSDLRYNIAKKEIESGKILEVLYPSAGCLLLSRKVLNSGVKYGLLKDTKELKTTDDIYFFKEIKKRKFKLYCDPSLICRHAIFDKYKDGKTHPIYD